MSNYTILERNVMDSLETDDACAAFLWACSLPDADRYRYKAEAFAREVDFLAKSVWEDIQMAARISIPMLPEGARNGWNDEVAEDLHRFLMDRHTFWRHPGRKTGWTGMLARVAEENRTPTQGDPHN